MTSECYCTLLRAAARRSAAIYDAALEPVGVNIAQFRLLRIIRRAGPLTLTALGGLSELDRSTIGRNVRVLERRRLVRLGRGEDQREACVTLTDEGAQVIEQGAPLWDEAQRAIEARIGPDAVNQLRATLAAL